MGSVNHTCGTRLVPEALDPGRARRAGEPDRLTDFFDELDGRQSFKRWYLGHFHKSVDLDASHTVLYDAIVEAGDGVPSWFRDW